MDKIILWWNQVNIVNKQTHTSTLDRIESTRELLATLNSPTTFPTNKSCHMGQCIVSNNPLKCLETKLNYLLYIFSLQSSASQFF